MEHSTKTDGMSHAAYFVTGETYYKQICKFYKSIAEVIAMKKNKAW